MQPSSWALPATWQPRCLWSACGSSWLPAWCWLPVRAATSPPLSRSPPNISPRKTAPSPPPSSMPEPPSAPSLRPCASPPWHATSRIWAWATDGRWPLWSSVCWASCGWASGFSSISPCRPTSASMPPSASTYSRTARTMLLPTPTAAASSLSSSVCACARPGPSLWASSSPMVCGGSSSSGRPPISVMSMAIRQTAPWPRCSCSPSMPSRCCRSTAASCPPYSSTVPEATPTTAA